MYIILQPSMMCGLAFPTEINQTFLYTAGASCGKNAAVGGVRGSQFFVSSRACVCATICSISMSTLSNTTRMSIRTSSRCEIICVQVLVCACKLSLTNLYCSFLHLSVVQHVPNSVRQVHFSDGTVNITIGCIYTCRNTRHRLKFRANV